MSLGFKFVTAEGKMHKNRFAIVAQLLALSVCLGQSAFGQSNGHRWLNVDVPAAVHRSNSMGHANPDHVLHVSVSLPYANVGGMEDYVDGLSDPLNPNYRNFLTPQEIGLQFGLPENQVQSVVDYLKGNGFKIKLVAKNHLNILADCTVDQAERAFNTTIENFHSDAANEPGNRDFFSFSQPLEVPDSIAACVLDVAGLESNTKPEFRALTPTQTRTLYGVSSMWTGGFHGEGRNVAISNFDGYRLSNVPLYYSQFSLPTPSGGVGSNITVKTISGGAGSGTPQGEGDLDIQMVLGMAPLCNFTIYDGGASDLIGTLTQEVNDNTADIISESYGWSLSSSMATSAHNLHLSMSAQGITYMAASGDSGTSLEPYSYPNYEPEVLMVGGTVATVDGSGNRTSEVGWSGSGGGWSTNSASFNTRPSWQVGNGVPTTINFRMSPDVALHASSSSGAYQFYLNGSLTSGYVGTSFACPVFAGSLAVAEQKIINQGGLPPNGAGKQRFGRIQNLFYSQNGRSDIWFDVTSGSNGTLPNGSTSNATAGWDMVTGWGAINFNSFVASQVSTTIPSSPTNLAATAGNGQVSLTWSASSGATTYNVKRATVSGGPYTTVASPATNSFTNTGLTNGTTYFYVVTAVNTAGESGNSNEASATPFLAIPPAPTNLTAAAGNGQVVLSWSASTGATSYNVKRATVNGGPYTTVASPTTNGYTNTGLANGTTYFYVVTAVNASGESGNSNQASATPNLAIPPIPLNLTATAGNGQVVLAWSSSSGATSYNVKRATVSGGPYTTVASPTANAYTNTGLTNGTTYYYVVTAVNTSGESGNSNQAFATPTASTVKQLLLNPGFESGTASWSSSAGVIGQWGGSGEPTHGGTWNAWLDGYGSSHTDTLYQQVTIPSTVTSATLSFWLHIDTAETTTTTAYDTLKVQVRNSSNAVLATLATYSNLNHNSGYVQKSFDLSAYKGQTIRVYLVGTEDSSLQTSFVVDDFLLNTQ